MNQKYKPIKKTYKTKNMSFEKKTAIQAVICSVILVWGIFVSYTNFFPAHKNFFHKLSNITWNKQDVKNMFAKGNTVFKLISEQTQSRFDSMIVFFDKSFGKQPKENTASIQDDGNITKEKVIQENPSQSENQTESSQQPVFRYPLIGEITSEFGSRTHPVNGNESIHYGIDIAGNYGDCVISSLPGTVSDTGVDPNLGNYVKIRHSENMETVYGHLSEILVRKDEVVDSNTRIGSVGSSGTATGPHVHLEVRIDGQCQDPMNYLTKK